MQKNKSVQKKILKKLGMTIKYYRSRNNLSQETLAFNIGVDRTYISAIELGQRSPSIYCLYLMAKEFDISIKDLLDINF